MKYIKFFALVAGMASLMACNDDKKDFNTASGVEVEMAQSQLTTRENRGIFNVPINVVGAANGDIVVTIDVEAVGTDGAHEAQVSGGALTGNYVITSKTLNIPKGVTSVNVQINAIDDDEKNEDRTFKVFIAKAEGASVDSGMSSTLVTIKDDDKYPYEKLQGDWTITWIDFWADTPVSQNVTIEGYEEGRPNYNKVLRLEGLFTNPPYIKPGESTINLKYFFDEETEECFIELDYGQDLGPANEEALPDLAGVTISEMGLSDQGVIIDTGYIDGVVSADRRTITFTPEEYLLFGFIQGGEYQLIGAGYQVVMTRR